MEDIISFLCLLYYLVRKDQLSVSVFETVPGDISSADRRRISLRRLLLCYSNSADVEAEVWLLVADALL